MDGIYDFCGLYRYFRRFHGRWESFCRALDAAHVVPKTGNGWPFLILVPLVIAAVAAAIYWSQK